MPVPIAEKALAVLEKGFKLWETFIATRQEAYNRKKDKDQVAAIEAAEKYIFLGDKIVNSLENLKLDKDKEFKANIKALGRYRKRFFAKN